MGSGDPDAQATGEWDLGTSYLRWSERGEERVFALEDRVDRLSFGRGAGVDLRLDFDEAVSQLHAELERLGRHWVVSDDGLSRHGTYVNGQRISGRCRLRDGDLLKIGSTTLTFSQPPSAASGPAAPTAAAAPEQRLPSLTERQREIVIALSRPFAAERAYAMPATNKQIAEETHLSVDAVKRHLRILFERFGIGSLPQNEKRVRLVELALEGGLISTRDLTPPGR